METEDKKSNNLPTTDLSADDLRVPVSGKTGSSSHSAVGSQNSVLSHVSARSRGGGVWIWVGVAVVAIALVSATIYFFLGRVNFNKGTVNFVFDPPGVNVMIDQSFEKQSVNSLSLSLTAGEHIILVSADGYLDVEREFSVQVNEDANMEISLKPIPDLALLLESEVSFVGLARGGQALVYMDAEGGFNALDIESGEVAELFRGEFDNVVDVVWSPGEPSAIVKFNGRPRLRNTQDNRDVRGRFIPLGERPNQSQTRDTGVSTWLFDDARHTADGWQPVLLNENIGATAFSPDGSQILYYYVAGDGEESVIMAHPDGVDWERIVPDVSHNVFWGDEGKLYWSNDDRYAMLWGARIFVNVDDERDREEGSLLLDLVNGEIGRITYGNVRSDDPVSISPDGTRIAFSDTQDRLVVWNILSKEVETFLEGPVTAFVWQTDKKIIISKADSTLWYWEMDGAEKPVQFISSFGELSPERLMFSQLTKKLFVLDGLKIFALQT